MVRIITKEENEKMLKVIEGPEPKGNIIDGFIAILVGASLSSPLLSSTIKSKNKFYKQMVTKEENEKMLKVIEGEPTWQERIQDFAPALYAMGIASEVQKIMIEHLKKMKENDLKNDGEEK